MVDEATPGSGVVYTATAVRDGAWWMVRVPQVDGLTQARDLSDVAQAATELVAVSLDVPVDEVRVRVVTGPDEAQLWAGRAPGR